MGVFAGSAALRSNTPFRVRLSDVPKGQQDNSPARLPGPPPWVKGHLPSVLFRGLARRQRANRGKKEKLLHPRNPGPGAALALPPHRPARTPPVASVNSMFGPNVRTTQLRRSLKVHGLLLMLSHLVGKRFLVPSARRFPGRGCASTPQTPHPHFSPARCNRQGGLPALSQVRSTHPNGHSPGSMSAPARTATHATPGACNLSA